MTNRTPPKPHELEISVFGRGYGEAILIHFGDDQWVLVDSLRNKDGQVSPVRYLEEIGANVKTAIQLIVVTHWHDDHIAGISTAYEIADKALLALPLAMNSEHLEAFKGRARKGGTEHLTSGVAELDQIAIIRDRDKRSPVRAAKANQILLRCTGTQMTHGKPVIIEALSPSDADTQNFLKMVSYSPSPLPGQRIQAFAQNDIAVALWVTVGSHHVLLGSDLETTGDPLRGWQAVLNSPTPPDGLAAVIKIPHHGSRNGHHDGIWNSLLIQSPIAVLTTWNRGTKLPSPHDISRICRLTDNAYITSNPDKKSAPRPKAVERKIREVGATVRTLPDQAGHVRLRIDLNSATPHWQVDLFNGASALTKDAA